MVDPVPRLTDEHRRKWALQVAALREEENDDEGSPEWQAMMFRSINERRVAHGRPPMKQWWETKTEGELHARGRALGLLH